jgi:hypothetical protein
MKNSLSHLSFIFILLLGCSDLAVTEKSSGSVEKQGNLGAARLAYDCVTATMSGGKKWTYKVGFVSNLQEKIALSISSSETLNGKNHVEAFGQINLSKVTTDTFLLPGKAKVKLVQLGARKSIEVEHYSTNLTASAENGWCKTLQLAEDSNQNTSQYGWVKAKSATLLNGVWKADPTLNPGIKTKLKFEASPLWGDTDDKMFGFLYLQTSCMELIDLGVNDHILSKTPIGGLEPKFSKLLAFIDLISMAVSLYKSYQCASNPTSINRQETIYWKSIDWNKEPIYVYPQAVAHDPAVKFKLCNDRPGTKYNVAEIQRDFQPVGYLCVKHWRTVGNTPEFIEVKSVDVSGNRGSEWIRFNKIE